MADGIFDFRGEFTEGLIVTVRLKDRVVTEAAVAARSEGDGSLDGAFKSFQHFAVESDGNGADEAGAAVFFIFELAQEFGDTFTVTGSVT